MISIEVRGFQRTKGHDFVAIASMWAHDHSKGYGEYPCNHFRLQGKTAEYTEQIDHQPWNSENVFSDESWLEVRLYLIRWCYNPSYGGWGCSDRQSLQVYPGSTVQVQRFFLPKLQLRQFYELSPRSPEPDEGCSTCDIATCCN
jgi:hypothetical protein